MAGSARNVLTPQEEDFPRWYQDVVNRAGLAEHGPARGTMIIKPWGYAIWERIQAELDSRIKATGADNVYFPLFIPEAFLQREASHVEGFSPELAVVTHAGGEDLAEPLVVRPTSETVIGDAMSRWVQGYRDLPLMLNQWSNVVRWELRPRLFLRTTEFLWQEGHTAHATAADAVAHTLLILNEVYGQVMRDVLAIPVHTGRKTRRETFAGAEATYALEGLMRDGRALQLGTSHYMGANFAQAFGIRFLDQTGHRRHAHTTSWGVSTRTVGGLIMAHGDDRGLRLPPRVAPTQVVVVAVSGEAVDTCERLAAGLSVAGVRVRVDAETTVSFGRRVVDWELRGVPVRVEIGSRDLAAAQAMVVRRDRVGKQPYPLPGLVASIPGLLDDVQRGLYAEAERRRDTATEVATTADEIDGAGTFMIPWERLGGDGEAQLAERGFTVRCLLTKDLQPPAHGDDADLVAWVARAY
ncbi:MAG TPA: proline--tRNA ligase [Euzebyales bacterium]|nr:proline--tRNA ligase [Euzebyales bacterium]